MNQIRHETNHGGYKAMIDKINNHKIYIKGLTDFIYNFINNCAQCNQKNNNKHKRAKTKAIILNHPKKRYIADITYLNSIFGEEYEFPYLLVIQEHFSKFCMAYPLRNKNAETVLKKIKKFFSYYGEPEEFGSDNGMEFVDSLLINFLNSKNIDFIRGMPYNPHSQGSAERLHQTLKKSLFAVYNEFLTNNDKSEKFDIKSEVLSICNNYNSIKHNATQYPPIKIFFSDNNDLFNKVIDNLKKISGKNFR